MKIFASCLLMFCIGFGIAVFLAPQILLWVALPLSEQIVLGSPSEAMSAYLHFGTGTGILFASIPLCLASINASREWFYWGFIYLLAGVFFSFLVAAFFRSTYTSLGGLSLPAPAEATIRAFPAYRIPLIGALCTCILAFVQRVFSQSK